MEKDNLFINDGTQFPYELNCSSDQLRNSIFNPNWDNSIDQNDPFESALSSMVSSPATSNAGIPPGTTGGENIVLRELIGRLGSICNSREISSHSYINGNNSTNNSCYTTPLNSPPKLNLSIVDQHHHHPNLAPFPPTDPAFVERAARFSCFANKSLVNGPIGDYSRENSSVSEQISQNDANSRKRKAVPRSSKNVNVKSENNGKRSKSNEDNVKAEENGTDKTAGDGKSSKDNPKLPAEPPKDYIHVRARRGQATDAHSLAERVRREKISERMKFLQDLVPGCNKVTGKAVMLDEIINYVQSLQRQVEFLSMKLATINPRMDINVETLLTKDVIQSRGSVSHNMYPSDGSAVVAGFPYQFQSQMSNIPNGNEVAFSMNHLNATMGRNPNIQLPPLDNFGESASQVSTFWEDDLQTVVQMGLGQNETQNFHG